jgi:hypothetical protein
MIFPAMMFSGLAGFGVLAFGISFLVRAERERLHRPIGHNPEE